ncbi:MAG: hypothetical protein ABS46_01720 [Cytophagaceae bacterium SCN 52-12]|nr:MAG: hypothetical protein ABS46_01720 [Cytophagaceae bacterium SCN 52-12]
MVAAVSGRLASLDLTIAFGESATAGCVAYEFSLTPGAGQVLTGGIICYEEAVKKGLLKVPAALIEQYTAESPQVTREIALGVGRLLPADVVVAVTGLVRPGGSESPEKPVGTIFFTVLFNGHCYDREIFADGSPEAVVETAIAEICNSLLSILSFEKAAGEGETYHYPAD